MTDVMRIRHFVAASLFLLVMAAYSATYGEETERTFTKSDLDQALQLFRNGGWWTTRLAPERDSAKEREWTILVLTSEPKLKRGINRVNVGSVEYTSGNNISLEMATTTADLIDRTPSTVREEFLKRFAAAIENGEVAAALVKVKRATKIELPAFDGPFLTSKEFMTLTGKLKFQ